MPSLGPLEIVVIAVVALLVFGPNRLPEMGRQVGRAVRELRKFQDSVRDELHGVMNSMDSPSPSSSGTPPTLPPVVAPGSTSNASTAPPRQTPPARPGGAQAPSRFRPSANPVVTGAAAAAATTPATAPETPPPATPGSPAPTSAAGAHAPSRFRSPKH